MKPVVRHSVSWFSAGVSSAVATRLAINEIDSIFYTHIGDQHPDTMRFLRECEAWFGKPITILQHAVHATVESVLLKERFINGPYGAPCTKTLKKAVRKKWQAENAHLAPFRFAWGFDADEADRCEECRQSEPEHEHFFPLVERRIGKAEAHEILKASGIRRPVMYDLGYHNNNCIGCVKGGMGYWNKIRRDFPDVFSARAKMEREVGASCINGVFLDELDPKRGRHEPPICDECGILCGVQALSQANNADSRSGPPRGAVG